MKIRADHNEKTCAIKTLNVSSITEEFSDLGCDDIYGSPKDRHVLP